MTIKDYTNLLPKNPKRPEGWPFRSLDKIKYIIVHQSLGGNGSELSLHSINNYFINPNHINKTLGLPGFAYHYAIDKSGIIYKCNDLHTILAHTARKNTPGIGVVLLGHFQAQGYWKTLSHPTDDQLYGLKQLLDYLRENFNNIEIKTHSDFSKRTCPGIRTEEYLNQYRCEHNIPWTE